MATFTKKRLPVVPLPWKMTLSLSLSPFTEYLFEKQDLNFNVENQKQKQEMAENLANFPFYLSNPRMAAKF